MFDRLRGRSRRAPSAKSGERIYAIGDVHGRYDLLKLMLDRLEAYDHRLEPAPSLHVVLLGDLIDRGPESARVLQLARSVQEKSDKLIVLKGNHEMLMIQALDGFPGMLRAWLQHGGDATLQSFGIDPKALSSNPLDAANVILETIPADLVRWLRQLPLTARSGDYLFCHAGIRPGVAINAQKAEDLLWIRNEFLTDDRDHGVMVVHGHSIAAEVEDRPNRIGIDTGAYRSGVLTALHLEGTERDLISVSVPVEQNVKGPNGPHSEDDHGVASQ